MDLDGWVHYGISAPSTRWICGHPRSVYGMIIPVGVNIFPAEVEALLPSTRQLRSRVVGVPDERLGRRPRGVVPRPVTRSN